MEITRGTILCLRPERELSVRHLSDKLKEAVLFFCAQVVRKPNDEVAGPWAQFDVEYMMQGCHTPPPPPPHGIPPCLSSGWLSCLSLLLSPSGLVWPRPLPRGVGPVVFLVGWPRPACRGQCVLLWNGTIRRGPACFLAGCCSVTYHFRAISRQFFAAAHVLLALGPAFERNCARYSLRRLRCCGSMPALSSSRGGCCRLLVVTSS